MALVLGMPPHIYKGQVRLFDFVSYWISTYWDIAWYIIDRTGDQSGYLDEYLIGVVFLVLYDCCIWVCDQII